MRHKRRQGAAEFGSIRGPRRLRANRALDLTKGPVLFWLDGHYSGGDTACGVEDCPIVRELRIIAARNEPGDVILIDDARLFGWRKSYPRMSFMRKLTSEKFPKHTLSVANDMIRILPSKAA